MKHSTIRDPHHKDCCAPDLGNMCDHTSTKKVGWGDAFMIQFVGGFFAVLCALTTIEPLLGNFREKAQTISFELTPTTLFVWIIALLCFLVSSFLFALATILGQPKPRYRKITLTIFEAVVSGIAFLGTIIAGFFAFLKLMFPSYSYEIDPTGLPERLLEITMLAYISSLAIVGARHYSNKLHDFVLLIQKQNNSSPK